MFVACSVDNAVCSNSMLLLLFNLFNDKLEDREHEPIYNVHVGAKSTADAFFFPLPDYDNELILCVETKNDFFHN